MKDLVLKFASDDSGATAIEYGLIAALIALGMIGGASRLGGAISNRFNVIGTRVTNSN